MRIVVLAVGRLKAGPERELVERYRERALPLARSLGFGAIDMGEFPESRARRPAERKSEETNVLLGRCGAGPIVAFDERGPPITSERFAERCAHWRDAGEPAIHLVIGGADGLDATARERASLVVSFGAATIPHQLVRILVVEQLYRAMTILAGHPYHRD